MNANSTVQYETKIKNGIMINVNTNVKSILHAKKNLVEILAHVFMIIVGTLKLLLLIQ